MAYVSIINGKLCGLFSDPQPGIEGFVEIAPAVVAFKAMTNSMLNPRVPATISDRQFYQQLAIAGILTEDEALAANAAIIPPPLLDFIDEMPADQQFSIKMIASGATVFERQNPLTISIGTAYGISSDQIDAFFLAASLL
jgi:hypothetical protein